MKQQHKSLKSQLTTTKRGVRLWQQEKTILAITELICKNLKQQGVSRSELAVRMERTPGYITQLLDGRANMTLRTISDAFTALNLELEPHAVPICGDDAYVAEMTSINYVPISTGAITFNQQQAITYHVDTAAAPTP